VLVTYSRLAPEETYHVSHDGLAGGLSRVLVLLNFPIALAAIGVVGVLLERGAPCWLGVLAIALCAVTAWPGLVDQDDLDARLGNVVPALGVALAAGLTARARPQTSLAPPQRFDRARVVIAASSCSARCRGSSPRPASTHPIRCSPTRFRPAT
jgi:hypothetical protein